MKFKNLLELSAFTLLLCMPLLHGCTDDGGTGDDPGDTTGDGDPGDGDPGDGDPGDGDPGDGDPGDGDPGDGDPGDGDPGDGDPAETGMLRLVHLGVFPNDENTDVDIFVNGEPSGITFAFKDGTDYVELPVGEYDFDVVPAGGTIDDSVYNVPAFPIAAGDMWEVFASGYVAPEGEDGAFNVSALPENGADIPAGSIRLNIVHAAALAAFSPVDVWVVDENCEPVQAAITDFGYGQYAPDVDLPAGALNFGLDVGQDATVDACFNVPDLGADIMVNVFAVNDSQGVPSLIAHLPDGSTAEVSPAP